MAKNEELIRQGMDLLNKIYREDVFKVGVQEDTMSESDMKRLSEWRDEVYSFLRDTSYAEDFECLSWLSDGNRVSSERIGAIIDRLEGVYKN